MTKLLIVLLLLLYVTKAHAVSCSPAPSWEGINANGVMEYCGYDGQVHALASGNVMGLPTPVAGVAPTPQATYVYTAPTPVPTATPQIIPTAAPTLAPPTPVPTVAQLSATYDPATLTAAASRCDAVTVSGIVASKPTIANPGVSPAAGCVIAGVYANATSTVTICWRNTFAASTACDTATSTWIFKQP